MTSSAHHVAQRSQRVSIALGLNVLLVGGEGLGAYLSRSSALLADAAHNLADVAALLLAFVALRLTLRRPTALRTFGYHRATILAALANVGILLLATVSVVASSIWRLAHVGTVHAGDVVAFATAATLLNLVSALLLIDDGHDLNLRAALVHLGGDALASLGVLIVGIIELTTHGNYVLDPVVSLVIALAIAIEAIRLVRSSVDVLLESVPDDIDPAEVASVIATVPGVDGVHHLHCWSLTGADRMLSAHVLLRGHPSLEEAQLVGESVKQALGSRFDVGHATLELECEPCDEGGESICTIEARHSA